MEYPCHAQPGKGRNPLRTDIGRFHLNLHKWKKIIYTISECLQPLGHTTNQIVLQCPIYPSPNGTQDLPIIDNNTKK